MTAQKDYYESTDSLNYLKMIQTILLSILLLIMICQISFCNGIKVNTTIENINDDLYLNGNVSNY